ncbi:hypothetical protein HY024_01630, partial [Candidatus Curtissbacteria bacterium]|nr:hypothetical protein [Candidatus Curtissbacteria bacterium]
MAERNITEQTRTMDPRWNAVVRRRLGTLSSLDGFWRHFAGQPNWQTAVHAMSERSQILMRGTYAKDAPVPVWEPLLGAIMQEPSARAELLHEVDRVSQDNSERLRQEARERRGAIQCDAL